MLQAAGYERYEVSAFAKNNKLCQHNLNYWQFGDYIGIGAGAHGKRSLETAPDPSHHPKLKILRTKQPSQPRLYQNQPPQCEILPIADSDIVAEFMLNTLRLVEGVEFSHFTESTGLPWSSILPVWQRLQHKGLVRSDRCATTALGLRYLDSVVAEFL